MKIKLDPCSRRWVIVIHGRRVAKRFYHRGDALRYAQHKKEFEYEIK